MRRLDAGMLIRACDDSSAEAGITIRVQLEPLGGEGTPVKPATYEGGHFQAGRRWIGTGESRKQVDILVIDNEPSQANRLEAALLEKRDELGLPDIVLDLSKAGTLPPHLPREISIFQFPHRNADAYLRDAVLDGVAFRQTEVGQAIFDATGDRADPLLAWCPQASLFGFWQSHLGKKQSQAKRARSWTSEIIGIEPAAGDVRRSGVKGDPLNLSIADPVAYDESDYKEWSLASKGKKLSDIGHGQVPFGGSDAALAGVSFQEIRQQATVSFASLRNVRVSGPSAEARAVLVALGLAAHVAAFGRAFHLRSGADLRPVSQSWQWLGTGGDEEIEIPDFAATSSLLRDCAGRAEAAGLDVGTKWEQNRLVVEPAKNLLETIAKSWPGN